MPNYGDIDYWNNRYQQDSDDPFDWLFSYNDLKNIINQLIPNKDEPVLLIGCGNAPFSPDM